MMRKLVGASLVALVLAACAQPGETGETIDPAELEQQLQIAQRAPVEVLPTQPAQQIQVAFKKHDGGDYATAAKLFLSASAAFPGARALAARSLMEQGKLAEAYKEAVQATRECESLAVTHFVLGLVAERDGRSDEAMEAYRKALDLDPRMAGAHNNVGALYYHQEDFYRARMAFEDAQRFAQDDFTRSVTLANLAELDELDEHLQLAEEKLDKALELAPESAHSYFSLAVLYDVTGREDAAISMARTGLELDRFGAARRAISFVWPELELHHDALLAEARGDRAKAINLWGRLRQLEMKRGVHWAPLAGRADAHLRRLVEVIAER